MRGGENALFFLLCRDMLMGDIKNGETLKEYLHFDIAYLHCLLSVEI